MERRLFNLAAAVSLVMMLALAGLWVWSYFAAPTLTRTALEPFPFPPTRSESALWCYRGYVFLRTDRFRDLSFKSGDPDAIRESARALSGVHFFLGRGYAPQPGVYIPVAVFATCTIMVVLVMWRTARRRAAGVCTVCGYDLRATPDRCPECGTPSTGSGQASVAAKPAEAAA
jgi:hypothetical protein